MRYETALRLRLGDEVINPATGKRHKITKLEHHTKDTEQNIWYDFVLVELDDGTVCKHRELIV